MQKITKRTVRLIISGLICQPAIVVMFAPLLYMVTPFASYQWIVEKSVQFMWFYFMTAIFLLIISRKYWMFLCFGCCAALCMFMKTNSNEAFAYADKTNAFAIKVANYNVSNAINNIDTLIAGIANSEADLLSIQEVNPVLDSIFRNRLVKKFPNIYSYKSADFYGMMILSKYPFGKADTFSYRGIPNMIGCINIEKEKCKLHFISSYLLPPFNAQTYEIMRGHLGTIAYKSKEINAPLVVLGTFNTVPWSREIQDFKSIGELSDSRIGFAPTYPNNAPAMLQVPYDHIFHSQYLACTEFETVTTKATKHTGIEGVYQFVNTNAEVSNPTNK